MASLSPDPRGRKKTAARALHAVRHGGHIGSPTTERGTRERRPVQGGRKEKKDSAHSRICPPLIPAREKGGKKRKKEDRSVPYYILWLKRRKEEKRSRRLF